MKKGWIVRLAILAVMLIIVAVMVFAEIGIATAFDIRYDGLTYIEYIQQFYTVPWHFMLALGFFVIVAVVAMESVYRAIESRCKD